LSGDSQSDSGFLSTRAYRPDTAPSDDGLVEQFLSAFAAGAGKDWHVTEFADEFVAGAVHGRLPSAAITSE